MLKEEENKAGKPISFCIDFVMINTTTRMIDG